MEVAFHSAPRLNNGLHALGFEMDVAQLSRGRLEGSFLLGCSLQLSFLSIQTNQDLLLQGNRTRRWFLPGHMPGTPDTTESE